MASPDLVWMVRRRETRGAGAGAARARRGGGGRGGGGDGARANASFYFCLLSRAAARARGYASGVPAAAPPGGCGGVPSSGDVTLGSRDQLRRLARPAKLRAARVAPAGALELRAKCRASSLHCRGPFKRVACAAQRAPGAQYRGRNATRTCSHLRTALCFRTLPMAQPIVRAWGAPLRARASASQIAPLGAAAHQEGARVVEVPCARTVALGCLARRLTPHVPFLSSPLNARPTAHQEVQQLPRVEARQLQQALGTRAHR